MDDELPAKQSKKTCGSTTLFREALKRRADARDLNFPRLCHRHADVLLVFRGRCSSSRRRALNDASGDDFCLLALGIYVEQLDALIGQSTHTANTM